MKLTVPLTLKRMFNGVSLATEGSWSLDAKTEKGMKERGWTFTYLGQTDENGKTYYPLSLATMYTPVPYHAAMTAKKGERGEHGVGSDEWYRDLVAVKQIKAEELPRWIRRKLG